MPALPLCRAFARTPTYNLELGAAAAGKHADWTGSSCSAEPDTPPSGALATIAALWGAFRTFEQPAHVDLTMASLPAIRPVEVTDQRAPLMPVIPLRSWLLAL